MENILFVDVWGGEPMYPSLSIAYLSSIAKQEGFSTKIISPNVIPNFCEDIFQKILDKEKPEYACFTLFTTQVFNAYKLIKLAKKSGCVIVTGGPHISSLGAKEVEKECKEIDYLFVKESEETFRDFLKGKIKKKIIDSGKFIEDINKLPFPDRSAYLSGKWVYDSNYVKLPIHILISSRGCPYQCNFCFKDTFGVRYRQRSIQNVIDECKDIMRIGGKELYFIDDLFAFDKKWVIEFCKEKIKQGINLPFKCLGRVDRLDEETLRWLKKAGCHTIAVGIESGDQEMVNWIRKGINLKDVKPKIDLMHKIGINVESYFIIGHRIDTKETIEKTIRFARYINTDFPRFFIFSPYPGSEVWRNLPESLKEKYWLRGIESDLRSTEPVSICELKPEELVEYWHKAHDVAYSNPRYFLNITRSFFDNPFNRIWVKKTINFVGGGILKMHRRIYK